ncbi:hypothetical protein VC191_09830 [Citrobacter koseri]|uniref:hypothetical protein n=1 Tax=Citrobacter koseri TaxID=545 RepID=UPI002B399FEF|nr:hypothetical protein [Citrobacter koseri]MEB2704092.1 hypothetical protein [Citrobacter koseri]MEB2709017.1 hypothetical protein [Citrobacter koseri]
MNISDELRMAVECGDIIGKAARRIYIRGYEINHDTLKECLVGWLQEAQNEGNEPLSSLIVSALNNLNRNKGNI